MNRSILLILCMGAAGTLCGQSNMVTRSGRLDMNNSPAFDNRYQGIKGSPYIMEEWYNAVLYSAEQPATLLQRVNFDRHALELCYLEEPEGAVRLLNKYLVDSFHMVLQTDTLSFIRLRAPGSTDLLFFEKLHDGAGRLYLDRAKQFVKADFEQPYSADRRYDEYRDEAKFYIQIGAEETPFEVSRNRKQVAAGFGADSNRILQFIKQEKVNLNRKEDLIRLMKYYDSLD